MILYRGKVYEATRQAELLNRMEKEIDSIRAAGKPDIRKVIAAVDNMGKKLAEGVYDEQIERLETEVVKEQLKTVIRMIRKEALEYRLAMELGEDKEALLTGKPCRKQENSSGLETRILPLGTLFHIAAGNMDGLPVYSVIEGLLTGNINILKLPQADNGLSIEIMKALIEEEPSVADFVSIFDTPSSDLEALKRMAYLSDGIVTWGGDEAIMAVRRFALPGTRLIEWGHKLSFAYLSGYEEMEKEIFHQELGELARHIVSTRQLLCSSCQVIYLDTEDMEQVYGFCRKFLPYLERAAQRFPAKSLGMRAELSLRRYCDTLNKIIMEEKTECNKIFQGKGCSLTACQDGELELSDMFGNCFVKRLPSNEMAAELRKKKGYLQTAGLICPKERRGKLVNMLAACGVVRITKAGHMSETFPGEAHDGEYPFRRYVRVVNIENSDAL